MFQIKLRKILKAISLNNFELLRSLFCFFTIQHMILCSMIQCQRTENEIKNRIVTKWSRGALFLYSDVNEEENPLTLSEYIFFLHFFIILRCFQVVKSMLCWEKIHFNSCFHHIFTILEGVEQNVRKRGSFMLIKLEQKRWDSPSLP